MTLFSGQLANSQDLSARTEDISEQGYDFDTSKFATITQEFESLMRLKHVILMVVVHVMSMSSFVVVVGQTMRIRLIRHKRKVIGIIFTILSMLGFCQLRLRFC